MACFITLTRKLFLYKNSVSRSLADRSKTFIIFLACDTKSTPVCIFDEIIKKLGAGKMGIVDTKPEHVIDVVTVSFTCGCSEISSKLKYFQILLELSLLLSNHVGMLVNHCLLFFACTLDITPQEVIITI